MFEIEKSSIADCFVIKPDRFMDERGMNMKIFTKDFFLDCSLDFEVFEELLVKSRKNVLRGMHYQEQPFSQAKLVMCLEGKITDVVVDLRKESKTYGRYEVFDLEGDNPRILHVPCGFAHGYLVKSDTALVKYLMSNPYNPSHENGIRWDSFGFDWGEKALIISSKDRELPGFAEGIYG